MTDFGFLKDPIQRQLFFEKIGRFGAAMLQSSGTYSRAPQNPLAAGAATLAQGAGPEKAMQMRLAAEQLKRVQGAGAREKAAGEESTRRFGIQTDLARDRLKAAGAPKPYTLGPGQSRYGPGGDVLAKVPAKPPAAKFANVDYPKGVEGPSMIDMNDRAAVAEAIKKNGKITARQATGTPSQLERGKRAQAETIKQVVPLIDDAVKTIGDAAGLVPAAKAFAGNILGQLPEGGVDIPGVGRIETGKGAIAGEVVDARQKVAILREQMIKAFRKSGRVPVIEQKRLLALVDTGVMTAPETARRNLEIIKKFFQDTFQRNTGEALPGAVPPSRNRKSGAVYNTPRGPMKWTGTGWLPAN